MYGYGYSNPFSNINFLMGLNASAASASRYYNALATYMVLRGGVVAWPSSSFHYGGGVGIYRR